MSWSLGKLGYGLRGYHHAGFDFSSFYETMEIPGHRIACEGLYERVVQIEPSVIPLEEPLEEAE